MAWLNQEDGIHMIRQIEKLFKQLMLHQDKQHQELLKKINQLERKNKDV